MKSDLSRFRLQKYRKIFNPPTIFEKKYYILCDFSRKELLKAIKRIVFCDFAIGKAAIPMRESAK